MSVLLYLGTRKRCDILIISFDAQAYIVLRYGVCVQIVLLLSLFVCYETLFGMCQHVEPSRTIHWECS